MLIQVCLKIQYTLNMKKLIEVLKEKRFSVEILMGPYFAQYSELEYFSNLEESENFYNASEISQKHMSEQSWDGQGNQPTFCVELRELKVCPKESADDEDFEQSNISEIHHTYSERLKSKNWWFSRDNYEYNQQIEDGEEIKDEWEKTEYAAGKSYGTTVSGTDCISLIDNKEIYIKGDIFN